MTSRESRLLKFIEERLAHMLEAPQMWGASESVELQILQLLEIRMMILGPATEGSWRCVQADYERFIATQLPGAPPTTLSSLFGQREDDVFPLLARFVSTQQKTYPSEDAVAQRNRNMDEIAKIKFLTRLLEIRSTYGARWVRVDEQDVQP
jgi:hypothetical protein